MLILIKNKFKNFNRITAKKRFRGVIFGTFSGGFLFKLKVLELVLCFGLEFFNWYYGWCSWFWYFLLKVMLFLKILWNLKVRDSVAVVLFEVVFERIYWWKKMDKFFREEFYRLEMLDLLDIKKSEIQISLFVFYWYWLFAWLD